MPPLSNERILECLNINYGIEIVALTQLQLGADTNASVYKAGARDEASYFIKLKHAQHQDAGIAVIELLHNAGIQHIIPPIKTIDNQPICCVDDFTLIVYPFIDGQSGFDRDLTDEQWIVLGKTLRQIHDIKVPLAILQQLRREIYSSKWREIVRSLYSNIEADTLGDQVALNLRTFMNIHLLSICQLVDRSEQLAQQLQAESPEIVLCHSDIHAGNVLIDGNENIFIVDWDDPIVAPKERDLMFIGGGVANVWNKPHEEKLFYDGYGKTNVNKMMLAYYRCERIVEDIAIYAQELLLTNVGGANRAEMYKHFVAMFEPNGVVDIALGSDPGSDPY